MARKAIEEVSQRKLNEIVRQSYNKSAWESVLKRGISPKDEAKAISSFLSNAQVDNNLYEFNGQTYRLIKPERSPNNTSYKDIETMFPELKRVKRGKNEVFINRNTGETLSRRQALNLYSEATKGEKYQAKYSREKKQRVNVWAFPFLGHETVAIPRTQKRKNSLMGEWENVVKQVVKRNSPIPLQEFCKKHRGKAVIVDAITNERINLCDVTFEAIITASQEGLLTIGNHTPYVSQKIA